MHESLFKKRKKRITNLCVVATHGNIHTGTIRTVKNIVLNSWLHGRCDDEYQNMRLISDTTNLNYSLLLARFDEKISFSQYFMMQHKRLARFCQM